LNKLSFAKFQVLEMDSAPTPVSIVSVHCVPAPMCVPISCPVPITEPSLPAMAQWLVLQKKRKMPIFWPLPLIPSPSFARQTIPGAS